jgi:hypothetical protein
LALALWMALAIPLLAQGPVVTLVGGQPQAGGTATIRVSTPGGQVPTILAEVGGAIVDGSVITRVRKPDGGFEIRIPIPASSGGESLTLTVTAGGQHSVTSTVIGP